jgi:hypothetical protein
MLRRVHLVGWIESPREVAVTNKGAERREHGNGAETHVAKRLGLLASARSASVRG